MRSDIQKLKAYHLFRAFDVNGSGQIDQADVDALARRISESLQQAADSPLSVALQDRLREYFRALVASLDGNRDGRVSQEEFLQFSARLAKGPQDPAEQSLQAVAEALFAMADHDGSGAISEREFVQLLRLYGTLDSAASSAFRLLDADKNGRITREEWRAFMRDVFKSQSLNDASALAFGPGSRGRT